MRVSVDSLCFCKRVGKIERMKATLFSNKGPAMAGISGAGTGFLIHRDLLLTTHGNLPSVSAAESSEIRLQNGVATTLVPNRFFITSSVLDLTIVGLDRIDGESNLHPHFLKTCSKPNLDLGTVVYLLGYTENKEVTVGEGKVVIATDNLIKLSTNGGTTWSPGSAGFDAQGNLAFMVCDPMKLATSPNTVSSSTTTSTSSSSSKRDTPNKQFGIPVPVICDWLNQHWEGSLDELTKTKLPRIRLMSTGQKSDNNSCASFTKRCVFKSTEADIDRTPSSSSIVILRNPVHGWNVPCQAITTEEEIPTSDPRAMHVQGIPTPEIYESPYLASDPIRKKKNTQNQNQVQVLDINFPPSVTAKPEHQPFEVVHPPRRRNQIENSEPTTPNADAEVASTGSVMSSSCPVQVLATRKGCNSSDEETMYSAETAESRNYTSPREGKYTQLGRSQSCVGYNRCGTTTQKNSVVHRPILEKGKSSFRGQEGAATSQRSNDYFSPTVSSIMKKRNNNSEQTNRPRQTNNPNPEQTNRFVPIKQLRADKQPPSTKDRRS